MLVVTTSPISDGSLSNVSQLFSFPQIDFGVDLDRNHLLDLGKNFLQEKVSSFNLNPSFPKMPSIPITLGTLGLNPNLLNQITSVLSPQWNTPDNNKIIPQQSPTRDSFPPTAKIPTRIPIQQPIATIARFPRTHPTPQKFFSNTKSVSSTIPNNLSLLKFSRNSLFVTSPNSTNKLSLINPAPETERVSSPFGWRYRPFSGQRQFHKGIDYGAPLGSPVVAAGDGIVTKVVSGCLDFRNRYCGGQMGNRIEVDHGHGAIAIYGHLLNRSITVKPGMKVWKNQEIAKVGSSGWSTGAHLDFRIKVNGEYENPSNFVTNHNSTKLD